MRWALLLGLVACTDAAQVRESLNEEAESAFLQDDLKVSVGGGAILSYESTEGGGRVRIRAQALDLRIELADSGCGRRAVVFEVENLPRTLLSTRRSFLDTASSLCDADRYVDDPHDSLRTALEGETRLDVARDPDTGLVTWTVISQRDRRALTVVAGAVESPGESGGGTCATLDAVAAGDVAAADLVVRHRLRAPPVEGDVVFAMWGNNAGREGTRAQLIESVAADPEVQFALVGGDLTSEGSTSELRRAAEQLDALPVPWFATLGDRDLQGGAGESYIGILGRSSFAFDVGNTRVVLLDSADASLGADTFSNLLTWLKQTPLHWAGDGIPPGRIVVTHFPPFDLFGSRGEGFKHRSEAARLISALQRRTSKNRPVRVPYLFTSHLAILDTQGVAGVRVVHSGGAGADLETSSGDTHHWLKVRVERSPCDTQPREGLEACVELPDKEADPTCRPSVSFEPFTF